MSGDQQKSIVQTLRFQTTQNASRDAPTEAAGPAAAGTDIENVTAGMQPSSQDKEDATAPTRSQIELRGESKNNLVDDLNDL